MPPPNRQQDYSRIAIDTRPALADNRGAAAISDKVTSGRDMRETKKEEIATARLLESPLGIRFPDDLPKYPLDGLKGDYWGESDGYTWLQKGVLLVLEVERGQPHVEGNVAKYWPWLEQNPNLCLGLIQAYAMVPGKKTKARDGSRDRVAAWLGNRMEKLLAPRFLYSRCVVDLGSKLVIEGEDELRVFVPRLKRRAARPS